MVNGLSGERMLIGLAVGIAVLIFLVLKTKIQAFLALIISTVVVGVIGGMPLTNITIEVDGVEKTFGIVNSITSGFGGTLGSIGIIIGFGVMMGQIFEVTGTGTDRKGNLQSNEEIRDRTWNSPGSRTCNHPLLSTTDTGTVRCLRNLRSRRRKIHLTDTGTCTSDGNCMYRILKIIPF